MPQISMDIGDQIDRFDSTALLTAKSMAVSARLFGLVQCLVCTCDQRIDSVILDDFGATGRAADYDVLRQFLDPNFPDVD